MIDADISKQSVDKKSSTAKSRKKINKVVTKKEAPVKAKGVASVEKSIPDNPVPEKNSTRAIRTADISSALLEVRHQQARRTISGKITPSALEQRLSGK